MSTLYYTGSSHTLKSEARKIRFHITKSSRSVRFKTQIRYKEQLYDHKNSHHFLWSMPLLHKNDNTYSNNYNWTTTMTQSTNTSPVLEMSSMKTIPLAGKRSQTAFPKLDATFSVPRSGAFRPLPPSLLRLPTIGNSSSEDSPQSSISSLDLDISDSNLDDWLVRLDKVTKAAEDERNTTDITRSVSRVSFASTDLSSSASASSFFQEPPRKRRRFARRNSFIVRDLAQLSRIQEQVEP